MYCVLRESLGIPDRRRAPGGAGRLFGVGRILAAQGGRRAPGIRVGSDGNISCSAIPELVVVCKLGRAPE
jgi:hypothetical protein